MGHDRERFTAVQPELICPTCLEVFKDPVKVCVEDHIFCRGCYDSYQSEQVIQGALDAYTGRAKDACAICRAGKVMKGDRTQNAKFVARIVGRLQVSCSNVEFGCGWRGELANEPSHLVSCQMRLINCFNGKSTSGRMVRHADYLSDEDDDDDGDEIELCSAWIRAHEMMDHKRHDCQYQQLVCPRGGKECIYLRIDKEQHPDKCAYHKCKIDKNCPTIGTLSALQVHEPYCASLHIELKSLRSMSTIQAEYSLLRERLGTLERTVSNLEDDNVDLDEENSNLKWEMEEMEWERDGLAWEVERLKEEPRQCPCERVDEMYDTHRRANVAPLQVNAGIRARDATIANLEEELAALVPCPLTEDDAEALMEITVPADFGITIGKRVREFVKEEEVEEDVPFKIARIA